MQYLILIYDDESSRTEPKTPEEGEAMMAPWMAYSKEMSDAGVMLAGEALMPTAMATTVRVRNGDTSNTDGPFAETREQLGGFYMIDCADLDEALKWAAKCPAATTGSIEVRPVVKFE